MGQPPPARVIWHRLAEEDLTGAYLHIGTDSPRAAERLLDAVAGTFRSPHAHGIRSWVVEGFRAYLIFCRVVDDGLEIVRFIHGARDIPRLLEDESGPHT